MEVMRRVLRPYPICQLFISLDCFSWLDFGRIVECHAIALYETTQEPNIRNHQVHVKGVSQRAKVDKGLVLWVIGVDVHPSAGRRVHASWLGPSHRDP